MMTEIVVTAEKVPRQVLPRSIGIFGKMMASKMVISETTTAAKPRTNANPQSCITSLQVRIYSGSIKKSEEVQVFASTTGELTLRRSINLQVHARCTAS